MNENDTDDTSVDFDYDRAAALLNIVQLIAGVAPQFTSISGEAMSELREMNDALVELAKRRAKEAEAKAGYDAAQRAEAENLRREEELADEERRATDRQSQLDLPNPALVNDPQPSKPIDHTKTVEQANTKLPPIARRTL